MDYRESLPLALQHSRELFIFHAEQRIRSVNFYLLAVAVFLAGLFALATAEIPDGRRALGGLVTALGIISVTSQFRHLDRRNEQLVHCDEVLLRTAEAALSRIDPVLAGNWEIADHADKHSGAVRHYETIVPTIFLIYQLLGLVGFLYSVYPWASSMMFPWVRSVVFALAPTLGAL